MNTISSDQLKRLQHHLRILYPKDDQTHLLERLEYLLGRYGVTPSISGAESKWDEHDVMLITYADTVRSKDQNPLATLQNFADKYLHGTIRNIHLLPFYPWSSDDGFSVIDYREVKPENGKWEDVRSLGKNFKLMFDLVLNHCSRESEWFKEFVSGVQPARHYFLEIDPKTDLSAVVRPRTSPLLTKTQTREGEKHVWTTFSDDQVDLNWANPDVLFEFLDIILWYVAQGAKFLRLDAVAFLWKELGTDCIHHPHTHQMVALLRDFLEISAPDTIIITETNVPHQENISYFGDGDEAHMVYNFTLPPLMLHCLLEENADELTAWAKDLSYPGRGMTYFNFTASHDGVGVRPLQGILSDEKINGLAKKVEEKGGMVSYRTLSDGSKSPYELNITYFSALASEDLELSRARFLCSQTVALTLKGVPGIYFHSLTGSTNNLEGVKETGRARTINRAHWDYHTLVREIRDPDSHTQAVFSDYLLRISKRSAQPAFHPDADQMIHQVSEKLFVIERISIDKNQKILAVFNFTSEVQVVDDLFDQVEGFEPNTYLDILSGLNLELSNTPLELSPFQAVWLVVK